MRAYLIFLSSMCLLSACAVDTSKPYYSNNPQLPYVTPSGKAVCADAEITCNEAATHLNMRLIQMDSDSKIINMDVAAARKRLIAAKEAYKAHPDAEHDEAVTEAQASLQTLISRRGY